MKYANTAGFFEKKHKHFGTYFCLLFRYEKTYLISLDLSK